MSKRYFCLLFAIVLLVFGCKGTPGTQGDDLDQPTSEPVVVIPEDDQNIDDSMQGALTQDDLTDQELSEENADGELATEDGPIDDSLADAGDNVEPEPVATAPVEPPPSRLEPAYTPVEVPTAPTTTPPTVTAVTDPEPTATEEAEEQPSTTETAAETPTAPRWPPVRPPVLEPPALRSQILPDEEPVFSRVVRVTAGQLLEIPFRGTGWVYLGEKDSRKGITYSSRRLESEGQNFVFRVESPGTYVLKFYKEDFIRDIIFNDYVQVIATENPEAANAPWLSPPTSDRNRVVAEPRWPSTLEEAEIARNGGRRTTSKPEVSAITGGTRPSSGASSADATGAPLTSGTSSPAASNIDRATPTTSGTSSASSGVRPPANNATTNGARPPANGTTANGTPPTNVAPVAPPPASPALPAVTDEGVNPVRPPAISGGADSGLELSDKDWPPEVFLQRAQEEFDAGRITEAIALLNRMRELYPLGNDELYWLLGQFYEANSPSRDILLSLDYYRRLINEFPQSRRYNDARRRIAYLERYYINIQ